MLNSKEHQVIQIDPPLSGEENMRKDVENLERSERLPADGFLVRIYEWKQPTISIGISQSLEDYDLEKMKKKGVGIVQRATGGLAVWHHREITYSVAAPIPSMYFGDSLYSSYKVVAGILSDFFQGLNLPVALEKSRPRKTSIQSPICFQKAGLYELTLGDVKVAGSAQKRRKKAFMQHGSLPLHDDQAHLGEYLIRQQKVASIPPIGNKVNLEKTEILKAKLARVFKKKLMDDAL